VLALTADQTAEHHREDAQRETNERDAKMIAINGTPATTISSPSLTNAPAAPDPMKLSTPSPARPNPRKNSTPTKRFIGSSRR
jgi:hypothetical protein